MTAKQLEKLMDSMAGAICATIRKSLDARVGPLETRLGDVETRLGGQEFTCAQVEARQTALEAKQYVVYRGVWKAGSTYTPGDQTTHHGSTWACQAPMPGEPSKDFVGWTLAVKRGSA